MHDSWARYYDFVFDECFGDAFTALTQHTLALVTDLQYPPFRVLDLGAGTGRLAVPLGLRGCHVTAVERSERMADVLAGRAKTLGLMTTGRTVGIETVARSGTELTACPTGGIDLIRGDFGQLSALLHAREQDEGANQPFDMILAIFTVLNYVVDEDALEQLARDLAACLRPGGHLVFDLAARRLFAPAVFESERLHREIEVREIAPDIFEYWDMGCGVFEGTRFDYRDEFTLRYWRHTRVLPLFARAGLVLGEEATDRLRVSGSRWFVLRRRGTFE